MVESAEASCLEVDLEEWAEGHRLVETCSSGLETGSVLMRKISPRLLATFKSQHPLLKNAVLSCLASRVYFTSCFSRFPVDVETRTLLGGWSVTSARHLNPKVSVHLLSLQVTASLEILL